MIDYTQPYIIEPNRVWRTWTGGRILDEISGESNPADGSFPEDWIASTTRAANAGREHITDEGIGTLVSADGKRLRVDEFFAGDPAASLGAAHVKSYGAHSRLLVKLLDSCSRLHIQAHPSSSWASQHLNSPSGKTEAWWILNVRDSESGWVYLGFQRPPTPEKWRQIIADQDIEAMEACFDKIPVSAGDVLLVDGGVPHAIGPGLLLLEVQEPTDFVVRCEYAHGGVELPESARTMGLGLDSVMDMFDYTRRSAADVRRDFGPRPRKVSQTDFGSETALLAAPQTDKLELRSIETAGKFELDIDGRFSVLLVLDGAGTVESSAATLQLQKWSRVLVPAAVSELNLCGNMKLARCLPPLG